METMLVEKMKWKMEPLILLPFVDIKIILSDMKN